MMRRHRTIIARSFAATNLVCTVAFICLCLSETALALDPHAPLAHYGHDVWQREQGLPHNSIHSILQGRDGYIWLATEEGLVRFDGVRFKVFDSRNTREIG